MGRDSLAKDSKSRKATPPYPTGFIPDPIECPNGALLDVGVAVVRKDMERVAAAYWAVVESAARAERWTRACSWRLRG